MSPRYPSTQRDDVVDIHHGESVADPYRWLEDTASADVAAWVREQNELTERFLSSVAARGDIRARLTELWDYPRASAPEPHGGRWFQLRNSGLQPQPVLYVMDSPAAAGRVLLDPNTLSDDGTVALSSWTVSHDGALLAYATSGAGSDWMTWRIRDIASGDDEPDGLAWSKFSGAAFSPDAKTLFYSGVDAPTPGREYLEESRTPRIMRHRLGTDQSEDDIVFSAPDQPEWLPLVSVTDDGRFLVLAIARGTYPENQLHVLDLLDPAAELISIAADFTASVDVAGNAGTTFYLSTDGDAERRRIVAVDVASEDRNWREVVPEAQDTLLSAHLFGGRLVAHYLHHARSRVRVFDLAGAAIGELALPDIATVDELTGAPDEPLVHLHLTSFVDAGSVWSHDIETGTTRELVTSPVPLDAAAITTEQVFVTAPDGTQLPVFLVHRRDVTATGDVPVVLYGYGGFNIPMTPGFSAARALWVERGGLLAVANLRGGGEYGRGWHDAGRLMNKQNVFDDFCTVARWLAGDGGWSRPQRIAINGGSNGGLLVGACLTQHPGLFGAAAASVGVFDMLRFHTFTIGWAWTSDYGDPRDPEQYRWLRAYSPLHNIRPATAYPPTLILTGDHDDRVAPGHSYKFAAALQAAQSGDAPILIRVETAAGHGAGKPTQKAIDEAVDLLSFVEHALGV